MLRYVFKKAASLLAGSPVEATAAACAVNQSPPSSFRVLEPRIVLDAAMTTTATHVDASASCGAGEAPASTADGPAQADVGFSAEVADSASAPNGDSVSQHLVIAAPDPVTAVLDPAWLEALAAVNRMLTELPDRADFHQIMQDTFGRAGSDADAFAEAIQRLSEQLRAGALQVEVEFSNSIDFEGARAAYAAEGHTGSERIYVDASWAASLTNPDLLVAVLAEEVGHAIDVRLNGAADSPLDEGEIFAGKLLGLSGEAATPYQRDDHISLEIGGAAVSAESPFENYRCATRRSRRAPMATWIMASDTSRRFS